jgi:hypothetical protein
MRPADHRGEHHDEIEQVLAVGESAGA